MRGVTLVVLSILIARQAIACGCSDPTSVDDPQVTKNADVIFVGDVVEVSIAIQNEIEVVRAKFKVIDLRKGVRTEFVTVEVHNGGTSCDLVAAEFQVGERYLISGFEIGPSTSKAKVTTDSYDGTKRFYNNYCSLRERLDVTPNKSLERTSGR